MSEEDGRPDGEHEKPVTDQLKQALDEMDLEGKVKAAAAAAEDVLFRGLGIAGQYVHERRDGIEAFIDRAASGLDAQTGGRFSGPVGELRDQLSAGVASLAERRWTPVPDDASELEAPETTTPDVPEPPDVPDDPGSWSAAADDLDDPSDRG
jgi:hypothetical protein